MHILGNHLTSPGDVPQLNKNCTENEAAKTWIFSKFPIILRFFSFSIPNKHKMYVASDARSFIIGILAQFVSIFLVMLIFESIFFLLAHISSLLFSLSTLLRIQFFLVHQSPPKNISLSHSIIILFFFSFWYYIRALCRSGEYSFVLYTFVCVINFA